MYCVSFCNVTGRTAITEQCYACLDFGIAVRKDWPTVLASEHFICAWRCKRLENGLLVQQDLIFPVSLNFCWEGGRSESDFADRKFTLFINIII